MTPPKRRILVLEFFMFIWYDKEACLLPQQTLK